MVWGTWIQTACMCITAINYKKERVLKQWWMNITHRGTPENTFQTGIHLGFICVIRKWKFNSVKDLVALFPYFTETKPRSRYSATVCLGSCSWKRQTSRYCWVSLHSGKILSCPSNINWDVTAEFYKWHGIHRVISQVARNKQYENFFFLK